MGHRTHKANGRYIFIPPENKGDAVTRRKSTTYEINAIKKDIARLEAAKFEMLEELDGLNNWIRQNDRVTHSITKEDDTKLRELGWIPVADIHHDMGDE